MRIGAIGATLALSLTCGVVDAAAQQDVCLKPWAIPDRWIDNHDETEPIDQVWTQDDVFETVDADGNPLPDADVYIPPGVSGAGTGFTIPADTGYLVNLKIGDANAAIRPGWSFAVDIGGASGGASAYRTAIATCDPRGPSVMFGDILSPLMGNLHGPTIQGTTDLIALDPTAYWDLATRTIAQSCTDGTPSCGGVSPRLGAVALFDPAYFEQTQRGGGPQLRVVNVVGVFVYGLANGYVMGVLTPLPTSGSEP